MDIRNLFAGMVLSQSARIGLALLTLTASALFTRTLSGKVSVFRWATYSLCVFLFAHLAGSVPLLALETFGVLKLQALAFAFVLVALIAGIAVRKKRGEKPLGEIDWNLKPYLLPVGMLLLGLILSWGNNGYFGMGQDQGVYQVRAIDLMYGRSESIVRLDEVTRLDTEEEREHYFVQAVRDLQGLDNLELTMDENLAPARLLNPDAALEHNKADGRWHGIPTYPALLAWWGSLFGLEAMSGLQTLVYLLTGMVLWLLAENLNLKKPAAALLCAVGLLSPELVWLSKSTLTEGLLALIISLFLLLLTNRERPERRWVSAFMVTAFAVFHVSIYVMIPMFLGLYWILYGKTGEKQYLRAAAVSAASFMLGFTFMVAVSPRYAIRNTERLWFGPVNLNTVYPVFMAAGGLALILTFLLGRWKPKGKLAAFLQSGAFSWILRAFMTGMLLYSAFSIWKKLPEAGFAGAVTTHALYDLGWMCGLVILPVILGFLLFKPKAVLREEPGVPLVFLFAYAGLLFSCVLMKNVEYCYYYGRYLAPYLPIAAALGAWLWNRFSEKKVLAGLAAGVLCMLPFDGAMVFLRDDTRGSYEGVERVAESVRADGAAVIFGKPAAMYFLPARAMTGDDCFFAEADVNAQADRLLEWKERVFLVASPEDAPEGDGWEIRERMTEPVSIDNNTSYRLPLCPFPYAFSLGSEEVTVYERTVPEWRD